MNKDHPSMSTQKKNLSSNPITKATHRREINRQVTLPFAFALILIIGIAFWFSWAGIGSIERWSQIALIFILLMGLVLGLIFLVISIGLLYMVTVILRTIPPYAYMAQNAILKIDEQIKSGSNLSVRPVIELQKFLAIMDVILGRGKE
ncbi:MAG: hypothetical protein PVF83_19875 [Anaerolineales bacterium]|jgi:predicted PurR-regulated permease PerM